MIVVDSLRATSLDVDYSRVSASDGELRRSKAQTPALCCEAKQSRLCFFASAVDAKQSRGN